uniref:Uncharacterized protein n=1 Tax=Oryza brachyantha TaxID=4533 RepID=J3M1R3_ORYBR
MSQHYRVYDRISTANWVPSTRAASRSPISPCAAASSSPPRPPSPPARPRHRR